MLKQPDLALELLARPVEDSQLNAHLARDDTELVSGSLLQWASCQRLGPPSHRHGRNVTALTRALTFELNDPRSTCPDFNMADVALAIIRRADFRKCFSVSRGNGLHAIHLSTFYGHTSIAALLIEEMGPVCFNSVHGPMSTLWPTIERFVFLLRPLRCPLPGGPRWGGWALARTRCDVGHDVCSAPMLSFWASLLVTG